MVLAALFRYPGVNCSIWKKLLDFDRHYQQVTKQNIRFHAAVNQHKTSANFNFSNKKPPLRQNTTVIRTELHRVATLIHGFHRTLTGYQYIPAINACLTSRNTRILSFDRALNGPFNVQHSAAFPAPAALCGRTNIFISTS